MNSICLITRTDNWGGVEKHTAGLINYLLENGFHVELVSCGHEIYADYFNEWKDKSFSAISCDLDVYCRGRIAKTAWASFLRNIRSNFVVLVKGGPYWGSFDFLDVCRDRFSRVLYIEHNITPRPPHDFILYFKGLIWGSWRWWYRDIFARVSRARYADHVIAVSENIRNSLIKYNHYPEEMITVIENGIDWWNFQRDEGLGAEFKRTQNLPRECFIFGMVTRLDYAKGVDLAIDAFVKLSKLRLNKEAYLIIIGEGVEKKVLQHKVAALNFASNIVFVDFLRNPLPAFSAFDVLLLPSRTEGLPLTLLEGMSAGCIPIVTRVGGMPSVIRHCQSGIVVEPNNLNELLIAMKAMMDTSAEERSLMGRHAQEAIRCQYNQNKNYGAILSVMSRLSDNSSV